MYENAYMYPPSTTPNQPLNVSNYTIAIMPKYMRTEKAPLACLYAWQQNSAKQQS